MDSLNEKINKSIRLLQTFERCALGMWDDGYWLAYSGGKDSDVILQLAKLAGVKYQAVYNVTTLDPPELLKYIRSEHPEVVFNRPDKGLLYVMVHSPVGPPTRIARWCCKKYKERGGSDKFKILGVRAAESPRRKKLWKTVAVNKNGGRILCPIVDWSDEDVWNFHARFNLSHCSLYDEGFYRLGCIGCPLGRSKQQRKQFERWPKYERAWKQTFREMWDRWHGVPTRFGKKRWFEDFGSWENLWEWWIGGKSKREFNGCDEVLLWG